MLLGFIAAVPLSRFVISMTLTTTGVLIPALPPVLICIGVFVSLLLLLIGFILIRTRKIEKVSPMKAIRKEVDNENGKITLVPSVLGKGISLRLALRQLISGKKRYIGALIVATLLVFFASLVGRMNSWLGTDGKGMMDAFNPADHDIGIQSFGELTQEKFEQTILTYTNITNTYVLAMPSVAVNGVDYTANVIDQPERFHILEGRTCISDNEIVLTEFVAKNFGVSIGDIVMVRGDSGSSEYTVSGIYSCANDMGDNVGLSREGYLKIGRDHPNLWCWHYFLADPSQKSVIAETLENSYGGDIHVHENTWPGLLGIISAMQALVVFMYAVVMIFILIVTVLTGSKILAAEQKDLGIYKAIGFQTNRLRLTFALRFGMTALISSIIGTILAAIFTDALVSTVMKLAGISNFASAPDILELLLPALIVTALFTGFGWLEARKIRKTDLTVLISE